MNCRQAREIMAAHAADDPEPREERELRDHILGCASCAGLEDQLKRSWDALSCHPTLEPSAEFLPKLRRRIQAERAKAKGAWHLGLQHRWQWSALALGAVAIAVLLTRPGIFQSGAPAPAEKGAASASRDAFDEQLLRDLDQLLEYSAADSLSAYDFWPGPVPEGPEPEIAKPIPAKKLMMKEPA